MSLNNIMDMTDCTLCPRSCRANRAEGEVGYCKEDAELYAARAALYFDEEPVISGHHGSGAVFFSGCNMGCIYCQNYAIAKAMSGMKIEPERLSEIFRITFLGIAIITIPVAIVIVIIYWRRLGMIIVYAIISLVRRVSIIFGIFRIVISIFHGNVIF